MHVISLALKQAVAHEIDPLPRMLKENVILIKNEGKREISSSRIRIRIAKQISRTKGLGMERNGMKKQMKPASEVRAPCLRGVWGERGMQPKRKESETKIGPQMMELSPPSSFPTKTDRMMTFLFSHSERNQNAKKKHTLCLFFPPPVC